jgi:ribosomal protein S18 acetylase RimI-like enzyme
MTREDGTAYQALRLESLRENPQAFLSTFETENQLHETVFADHLDAAYHPPHLGYFGIFINDELAGYVQIATSYLEKQKHIVFLNNLYVGLRFRRHKYATQLLNHVFAELHAAGVERIYLSCTARNAPAQRLYRHLDFHRYGVKTKAIKWQNSYDDEVEMVKIL